MWTNRVIDSSYECRALALAPALSVRVNVLHSLWFSIRFACALINQADVRVSVYAQINKSK